jgi:pantoate--beta-alanine ligase
MSSRNRYLTPQERQWALAIPRALEAARAAAHRGVTALLAAADHTLSSTAQINTSYLVAVEPTTFQSLPADYVGPARVLIAARVGTTRLIDNALVDVSVSGAST